MALGSLPSFFLLLSIPTAFASSLTQARRLGSITGFVHGTSGVNDPAAQGTLRLFETIISAMQPEEKADLSLFNSAARQRVATEAGCTVSQVDDCIARYLWTKNMASRMAQLRREGREMPKSIDELEKMVGSWRGYKSGGAGAGGGVNGGVAAVGPDGETCPLAGMEVGKNTKCPKTRKAYKACCGRKAPNK